VSAPASTISAYAAAASVRDPELWVLSIADLGILRSVREDPGTGLVEVAITPTYAGCPAMDTIRADLRRALARAGYLNVRIDTVLQPAWTTDMITEAGRERLRAAGIAPPDPPGPAGAAGGGSAGAVMVPLGVRCPRCGSVNTEEISHFGSTACKALHRCRSCGEPFDRVKPL
jgi:ring-1,2-phenylacetyl-CoA epoxidase subunit PaaD